jgi:hypothetical protein
VSLNSNWIDCEFESDPGQNKQEPSIVRRIQMGEYNGKPLYWVYLGHYDDETDLFLSEDIICERPFDSKLNDWFNSELAKWLSVEFVEEAFTQSEYHQLVPIKSNGLFGHKLFLLSKDEYEKYRNEIPREDNRWWLRSPSKETCKPAKVATVKYDGSVNAIGFYVNEDFIGVRPALRLRRG